jgi:2-methylisocitrate lyase-like PEP mutase family enzyme
MYHEAGADALFIEAVVTEEEAAEVARALPDVPLLFNWAEGGKTPPIGLDRLKELGYRIVIFPISTLLAATSAMRWILQEIAQACLVRPIARRQEGHHRRRGRRRRPEKAITWNYTITR